MRRMKERLKEELGTWNLGVELKTYSWEDIVENVPMRKHKWTSTFEDDCWKWMVKIVWLKVYG